jgi:hypothetical protein
MRRDTNDGFEDVKIKNARSSTLVDDDEEENKYRNQPLHRHQLSIKSDLGAKGFNKKYL